MTPAVIVYGPPASGKDTVTSSLNKLDARFRLFPRLKVGPGRTTGYRLTTESEIDKLRSRGGILWENSRYDATYVIDRPYLARMTEAGEIPVIHLGQVEAVHKIASGLPNLDWLTVYLWCLRDVAIDRIRARGTGDTDARIRAWNETEPLESADLFINSAEVLPEVAAGLISEEVRKFG